MLLIDRSTYYTCLEMLLQQVDNIFYSLHNYKAAQFWLSTGINFFI